MPLLSHWCQWLERCALGRCEDDTRRDLVGFAHARFRYFLQTYAHRTNAPRPLRVEAASPHDAWHCLESYVHLHGTRTGQPYKLWLAARAAGAPEAGRLPAIESGVTLLMRDAVRERLRLECSRANTFSLEAPVGDHSDRSWTLSDLLPADTTDPHQEVALREQEAAARTDAEALFRSLDRRARVALLARELGWALSNPHVCAVAGCGKSVLANTYRQVLLFVAQAVQRRYAGEPRSSQAQRAVLTYTHLRAWVVHWGRSETSCAGFFKLVETEGHRVEGNHGRRATAAP